MSRVLRTPFLLFKKRVSSVKIGWFFIDISSIMSSFGPASRLPQGIVSLHPWNTAGPPGKFLWERFFRIKVSRMHNIRWISWFWGHLTRPRGLFRAQGSALTRNVARLIFWSGSKNLFHRAILYRHKKILLSREDCRQDQGETIYKFGMFFHWYLRICKFVWARVLFATRYCQSAPVECSGTTGKIHVRETSVSQGVAHA